MFYEKDFDPESSWDCVDHCKQVKLPVKYRAGHETTVHA